MATVPRPTESNFTPAPDGPQAAACYRVIDLGTQDGTYMGKPKRAHKVLITWELFCDEKLEDGRPFSINKNYTWSMHEKAALRKDLEMWRGKAFTEGDFDEKSGFQIESIIHKPCLLTIVHEEKNEKVYANVKAISRLPKQMAVGAPTQPSVFVWLTADQFDAKEFDKLSDGLKDTIRKSPEYQAVTTGKPVAHTQLNAGQDPDDEIPF
jgi:hypothetical protein